MEQKKISLTAQRTRQRIWGILSVLNLASQDREIDTQWKNSTEKLNLSVR
jgi:hypothetical protein